MLRVHSIVDQAVKRLEEMIVKGRIAPGQKIKELEISQRLGVSRPPLREAFKILEAEGLVRREPRRGVFVAELSRQDVWEIYTLKTALYTLAATLAIDSLTPAGLVRLEKIVGEMEALVGAAGAPGAADIERYEELNNLFHDTTAAIAGHGRLKKIHQSLNNQIKRMALHSLADRGHLESSCRYHRRILEAIRGRDKALAEKLTREHVDKGLAAQELLRRDRRQASAG